MGAGQFGRRIVVRSGLQFFACRLWLTLGLIAWPAMAAEISAETLAKNRLANAACLACHSLRGMAQLPKPDLNLARLRGLVHDPLVFEASVHGRLACSKCHTEGYEQHPHAADARDMTSTCLDCHGKIGGPIEAEFAESVHARNLADWITCLSCHDPHSMRVARQVADPAQIVAMDNRICLGCHDSDQTFARYAPERKLRPDIDQIHAWLPNTRMHWKAVRCVECHTPLSTGRLSHQILDKTRATRQCVACHSANSELSTRLYRYLAQQEQRKSGFLNSVMLGNAYVISATRNARLDGFMFSLIGLTVAAVVVHGLLRIFFARRRRSQRHD